MEDLIFNRLQTGKKYPEIIKEIMEIDGVDETQAMGIYGDYAPLESLTRDEVKANVYTESQYNDVIEMISSYDLDEEIYVSSYNSPSMVVGYQEDGFCFDVMPIKDNQMQYEDEILRVITTTPRKFLTQI